MSNLQQFEAIGGSIHINVELIVSVKIRIDSYEKNLITVDFQGGITQDYSMNNDQYEVFGKFLDNFNN